LLVQVIPTIVGMFEDRSKLPWVTLFMIAASDFLQAYWLILIVGIVGVIVAVSVMYSVLLPFKMFADKLFIYTPILWDVTRTFYMYRFSKLLSDFYKAWVSPVSALEQMANIFENYYYKKKTLEIKKDLESWFGFSESIEGSDLFDGLLVQILLVGEDTGNVWEVLGKMAIFYRDSLSIKIETLMGFLEPILMAFIAVVIGIVVWSIFLPMADLVNVIGAQGQWGG
jgi:type IV pilus assembly protein PilC